MAHIHDLGDNRKTGFLLRNRQKPKTLCLETLEVIRRRAGLERAAAQQLCARLLHIVGNAHDLFFRLDRAGTCDHREVAAADFDAADIDNRIVRMELAVAAFERVGDAAHGVDDIEACNQVHVDGFRVADESEDGLIIALRNMDAEILGFEPADQLVTAGFTYVRFQNNDHGLAPPKNKGGTGNLCRPKNLGFVVFCASQIALTIANSKVKVICAKNKLSHCRFSSSKMVSF